MAQFALLAFLKTLVITVGSNVIYVLYGLLSNNPYEISLAAETIFFLVIFLVSFIEYVWENRKKSHG